VERGGRREKMRTMGSSTTPVKKGSMGIEDQSLKEAWEEVKASGHCTTVWRRRPLRHKSGLIHRYRNDERSTFMHLLWPPHAGKVDSNRSLLGGVKGLVEVAQQVLKDLQNHRESCWRFLFHRLGKLLEVSFFKGKEVVDPTVVPLFFGCGKGHSLSVLRVRVDGKSW
jgi:hypothetical protein